MSIDSVSSLPPTLPPELPEQELPAPPEAQMREEIILPSPEQLKILEEMGMPITQGELDSLKQEKAAQDAALRDALPMCEVPENPY